MQGAILQIEQVRLQTTEVEMLWHILTSEGILPDPARVEAITQMPRPHSKTGQIFTSAV